MGKTIIHLETEAEISEKKAEQLAEMFSAILAIDDLFLIMRGQFIQLAQNESMQRTFGKEIMEAKQAGTFPHVEVLANDALEVEN